MPAASHCAPGLVGRVRGERDERRHVAAAGREAVHLDRIETAHHRHVEVDHHEIELPVDQRIEGLLAVADQVDLVAGALQHLHDHELVDPVVLGDQDAPARPDRARGRSPPGASPAGPSGTASAACRLA